MRSVELSSHLFSVWEKLFLSIWNWFCWSVSVICLRMHDKKPVTFQSEAKLGQLLLSISLQLQLVWAPLGDACQRELQHLGKALKINQGFPLLPPAAVSPWLEEACPPGKGSVAQPCWCPDAIGAAAPVATFSPGGSSSALRAAHAFALAISAHTAKSSSSGCL